MSTAQQTDTVTYRVTYIHKVSQICVCKHPQSSHRRIAPALAKYPGEAKWMEGPCGAGLPGSCNCKEFAVAFELHALPADLLRSHRDRKALSAILRDHGLISRGDRLDTARIEGSRLVCFPQASIWHSSIIEPHQPEAR